MSLIQSHFKELEVNRLIKFIPSKEESKLNKDVIDRLGRIVFLTFVKDKSVFETFPWVSFYEGINWQWMTKDGTLPKRIAKWYYTQTKSKLSDQIVSRIGDISKTAGDISNHFCFDITKDFSWKAGDFSDGASCFFASRSEIRIAMQKHKNFYAIRFYSPIPAADAKFTLQKVWHDDNDLAYVGRGRAFLYVDTYVNKAGRKIPFLLIFNGYGYSTSQCAGRLSYFLNLPTKRIVITNNNDQHGGLYLNDGGFVISTNEVLAEMTKFDFSVKNSFDNCSSPALDLQKQRESSLRGMRAEQEMHLRYMDKISNDKELSPLESILKDWAGLKQMKPNQGIVLVN